MELFTKKEKKMKKNIALLLGTVFMLSLTACTTPTQIIDTENDTTERVAALEGRDFETAAAAMVEDMLMTGTLNRADGQPYIMMISRIQNNTMQRIDIDELTKTIRISLMRSGKARVTTFQEDNAVMQSAQLRYSNEFNQANVRGYNSLAAPELSLSGIITQREFYVSSGVKRIEYRFSLSMTDLRTGLTIWEGEKKIKKLADRNAISW